MKITARVILRSLAATPLRVTLVYAGMIALLHFDFRPFPEWTADAIGFFIQFVASYLLAFWVLHLRSVRWSDGAVVAFTFIVVGTLLELLLAAVLHGPSPHFFSTVFTWQSFALFFVCFLGVSLAVWRVRRRMKNVVLRV